MLQAFVDDSGESAHDQRLILAGYVKTEASWVDFSTEWAATLHRDRSIGYLHMADAEALVNEFQGWTKEQRDLKLQILSSVIAKHRPWSFEVSVNRKDFDQVFKPIAPYELRHPYFPCFCGVVIKIAQWHVHDHVMGPVNYVFDEQGTIGTEAVMWYEVLKGFQESDVQASMGSLPIFRNDKNVLPLQAADLLVWHLRRSKEPRFAQEHRPVREIILGTSHIAVHIDRAVLAKMANQMSKLPGIEFTRDKKGWNARKRELRARLELGLGPPRSNDDLVLSTKPVVRPRLGIGQKMRGLFRRLRRSMGNK